MRNVKSHHRREAASCNLAFTLVELLVTIGIIAILMGLLLGVITQARQHAYRAECASNLRQLIVATTLYLDQYCRYPANAIDTVDGGVIDPTMIDLHLINALCDTMHLREASATTRCDQLPAIFLVPQRTTLWEGYFDPVTYNDSANPYWYTGYMYSGALDDPTNVMAMKIDRKRIPDRFGKHRGVLWCDEVYYQNYFTPGYNGYVYWHTRNGAGNIQNGVQMTARPFVGMHRGWTDGSVEWVNAADIDTKLGDVGQVAYQEGVAGGWLDYFYF
jgi:prepilin-type N-terminal cleavage/methylation domain-containing protein